MAKAPPVVPLPATGRWKRRLKAGVATLVNPSIGLLAARSHHSESVAEPSTWPFPEPPTSILLVRFDVLGDTAMSLPLAADLKRRFPGATVVFATTPGSAPLARLCRYIDDVLAVDAPALTHLQAGWKPSVWRTARSLIMALRRQRFDLAISLYGPLSGAIVGLSGSRWRVGVAGEAASGNFDFTVPGSRAPGTRHEIEWVRGLGGDPATDLPDDLLSPGPEARAWAAREVPPDNTRQRVVINPGARTGSAKLWPDSHWRKLVELIASEDSRQLVFVGGPEDSAVAARLLPEPAGPHRNLSGKTSIPQLVALLATADLTISADSGPLHLAALLGRPALGLYGPTDPTLSGPYGPAARTIVTDLPCHPCYDLRAPAICPFGDALCMDWIAPIDVYDQVVSMLDPGGTG